MWCPDCGIEYRRGFTTCADCGATLVESPVPHRLPAGAEDGLEPCLESADRGEIAMLAAELESLGVPYVLQAGTALALLDGERLFAGRSAGAWEGRVWVHAPRLAEALEVLREVRGRRRREEEPVDLPQPLEGETMEEFERRTGGRAEG